MNPARPAGPEAPPDWHVEDRDFTRIVSRVEGRRRASSRVRALGWAFVILNGLGFLAAGVTFLAIAPWGFLSGDPTAAIVLGGIATALAGLILALSLPGLVAGVGLLHLRSWARTLAIVLSGLSLFSVPFGTILGVVGLYVLLQDDVQDLFEDARRA